MIYNQIVTWTAFAILAMFLAFKRASHPASPLPRSRPRPLDKKLCFHNVQPTKNVPNPLKLTKKMPKAIWASFYNNHPIIGQLTSECIICPSWMPKREKRKRTFAGNYYWIQTFIKESTSKNQNKTSWQKTMFPRGTAYQKKMYQTPWSRRNRYPKWSGQAFTTITPQLANYQVYV